VQNIGTAAFSNCNALSSVIIQNGVTTLSGGLFSGCSSIVSAEIPESVTSIKWGAFAGVNIDNLTVPDSVTEIGTSGSGSYAGTFDGVKNVIYHGSVTEGSPWGAQYVNKWVEDSFVFEDSTKQKVIKYLGSDTSVTIPDGVVTIVEDMFAYSSTLVSVSLPDSVSVIEEGAFSYCSNLSTVELSDTLASIGKEAFFASSKITDLTVPDSVTEIGQNAFVSIAHITYNGPAEGSPWGAQSIN